MEHKLPKILLSADWIPRGYMRVEELAETIGADVLRNELSEGLAFSCAFNPHSGEQLLIRNHEWRAREAASWLKGEGYALPGVRRRWIDGHEVNAFDAAPVLVAIEDAAPSPIPGWGAPGYMSPIMELMVEAVSTLKISEEKWPKLDTIVAFLIDRAAERKMPITRSKAIAAARLCRPPQAEKGGNQKW